LDLDPRNGDRVWIDLEVSWLTSAGDAAATDIMIQLQIDIDTYAQETYPDISNTRYVSGDLAYEEYNPLYSNDAMPGKDNRVKTPYSLRPLLRQQKDFIYFLRKPFCFICLLSIKCAFCNH
jgi:hypothetical protein